MKQHPLLQNPLNRDVIALLAASNIPSLEKELWIEVIPDMTDDEKEELKRNLQRELKYEAKISEKAVEQFVTAMQKGI